MIIPMKVFFCGETITRNQLIRSTPNLNHLLIIMMIKAGLKKKYKLKMFFCGLYVKHIYIYIYLVNINVYCVYGII